MSVNFDELVAEHYGNRPHPLSRMSPPILVKDWETAVRLATATKFGGHAEPHEVELFWKEFQSLQMPPTQYMDLLDRLSKWSFRYHDKPPTMSEIQGLRDAKPAEQHKHYKDLPDSDYPDLSAHEMQAALAKADIPAKQHLQRGAFKNEARGFHHSGMGSEHIDQHYQRLAEDRDQIRQAAQPKAEPF
jgi:hypothetical protein